MALNFLGRLLSRHGQTTSPASAEHSSASLDRLLMDIGSKTPATKASALMSVSMLNESAVDALLRTARAGRTRGEKQAAIAALGILGNQRAVEPLGEIIKIEKDPFLFGELAGTLGRLGDERAVNVLIALLEELVALAPKNDPNDPLGLRDPRRSMTVFIHAYTARRALANALGALHDERAVPVLLKTLQDDESYVALAAAEALADMGRPGIDALITTLSETPKTAHVHSSVAFALEKCGGVSEAQIDLLVGFVKDGSIATLTRTRVASVLGSAGDRRAVGPLICALDDSLLRQGAASALGELGDRRALEPLVSALDVSDIDLRKTCCAALGKLGDKRAVEALVKLLGDTDDGVRLCAAFALARLQNAQGFDDLVGCLSESKDKYQRARAAAAIAKLGDRRAVGPLTKLLGDPEEYLRKEAITALGEIGCLGRMEVIAKCLKDSKVEVQLAAAGVLSNSGDARGFDVMLATLLTDTLEHRLLPAISGLGALGDSRAVAPLALCLRGSTGQVRRGIIAALSKIGAPAEEALRPLLSDPRPSVRIDAQTVLDQIAAQVGDGQYKASNNWKIEAASRPASVV